MQRMHVGLKVSDIDDAVAFYSRLFGQEPTLQRDDYAKWMLDDPYLNFSVDLHGDGQPGTAHFGLQQPDADALAVARAHVDTAALPRDDQDDLVCGYQLQHKSWVFGPDGEAWEMFFTEGIAEGGAYGCEDMPGSCST
jgi:catechol 2,3-dioxygenase-like lactoylglutathione lyase family enzyme